MALGNSEEVFPEFDTRKDSMTKKLYFMPLVESSKIFARALKHEYEFLVFDYVWWQNEVFTFEKFYYQEEGINESGDNVISPCEGMVSLIAVAGAKKIPQQAACVPNLLLHSNRAIRLFRCPLLFNFYEGVGYAGEVTPWNNLAFPHSVDRSCLT